jgi:hypothetical protein
MERRERTSIRVVYAPPEERGFQGAVRALEERGIALRAANVAGEHSVLRAFVLLRFPLQDVEGDDRLGRVELQLPEQQPRASSLEFGYRSSTPLSASVIGEQQRRRSRYRGGGIRQRRLIWAESLA